MWLSLWFDTTNVWSFGYAVNQHASDHEAFCQKHDDKKMYISFHRNAEDAVERAERVSQTHVMNVRFKQEYGAFP